MHFHQVLRVLVCVSTLSLFVTRTGVLANIDNPTMHNQNSLSKGWKSSVHPLFQSYDNDRKPTDPNLTHSFNMARLLALVQKLRDSLTKAMNGPGTEFIVKGPPSTTTSQGNQQSESEVKHKDKASFAPANSINNKFAVRSRSRRHRHRRSDDEAKKMAQNAGKAILTSAKVGIEAGFKSAGNWIMGWF